MGKKTAASIKQEAETAAELKADKLTRRYRALIEELVRIQGGPQASGAKKAAAELLGVHPTYISRVLGWQKRVGWHLAEQACKRLEINPRYFVASEDNEPDPAVYFKARGADATGGVRLVHLIGRAREHHAAITARAAYGAAEEQPPREEAAATLFEQWDALTLHELRARAKGGDEEADDADVFATRLVRECSMVVAGALQPLLPAFSEAAEVLRSSGRDDLADVLARVVAVSERDLRRAEST